LTYYLDGNNVLGGGLDSRGDDARPGLLNHLLAFRLPRPCVVVFDGPPFSEGGGTGGGGAFRLIFSGARKADDLIAERLRRGDTVVTRDRDLILRARDRQARAITPKEFFEGLRPLRVWPSGREKPEPGGDVAEWLAIFGHDESKS